MALPSETSGIKPSKARKMLRDNSAHGHELSKKQRGMLGAIVGKKHAEALKVQEIDGKFYVILPSDPEADVPGVNNNGYRTRDEAEKAKKGVQGFSEKSERLGYTEDWVDVFESGTHRGQNYGPDYIEKMNSNFKKLSTGEKPILTVPVVVGHDENQKFLNDSGWPAGGWPYKTRVVPGELPGAKKLQAKWKDIPPVLADAINDKMYKKVSAEVYDDFVDPEGVHHGPTLRRIAVLGGEIPQVKTLDDLPKVMYRETPGTWMAFTELKTPIRVKMIKFADPLTPAPAEPQDRQAWEKKLRKTGFNVELLKGADDALVAEIVRQSGGESPQKEAEKMATPREIKWDKLIQMRKEGASWEEVADAIKWPGKVSELQKTVRQILGAEASSKNDELDGINPEDSPAAETNAPASGPGGLQSTALQEHELDSNLDPNSASSMADSEPSDMDDEVSQMDEDDEEEHMASYAEFHKNMARKYSVKYAEADEADKPKFAASAKFHRNMAKRYDERQFPEREVPEPVAAPNQARPTAAGGGASHMAERRRIDRLEARQIRSEKMQERAERKRAKKEVIVFCETMVRQGRLLPAQKDATVRTLLELDDSRVKKFGERTMTARQHMIRSVKKGPVLQRFTERIREAGQQKVNKFTERKNRLNKFWERHGEELEKGGESFEKWLSLAESERVSDDDFNDMVPEVA